MINLEELQYLDLYDNIFDEMPTVIPSMKNLKGLDLEYNYFNTSECSELMDLYTQMKYSIRKRLTGNSQFRKDTKKQPQDYDYSSAGKLTNLPLQISCLNTKGKPGKVK